MKAVAERYAEALAEAAFAHGAAENVRRELADFTSLFEESADLRSLLASPAVSRDHKQNIVSKLIELIGGGVFTRNCIFILIDHRRTPELPHILIAYEAYLREREGVAEAHVSSAAELSAAQKTELSGALERLTGKKIEARYTVDPALLGGAVVRIGTTIYDGSVREQLDRMREQLASE